MKNYYIATRLTFDEMEKALGRPVLRMNQRLAGYMRMISYGMGISKTQRGRRLDFFEVTEKELKSLRSDSMASWMALKDVDWHPVLFVDQNKLNIAIDTINKQYKNKIIHDGTYTKNLYDAIRKTITKIRDDKELPRQYKERKNPGNVNNIKVGDYMNIGYYGKILVRVTRISDKSYWYVCMKNRKEVLKKYGTNEPIIGMKRWQGDEEKV